MIYLYHGKTISNICWPGRGRVSFPRIEAPEGPVTVRIAPGEPNAEVLRATIPTLVIVRLKDYPTAICKREYERILGPVKYGPTRFEITKRRKSWLGSMWTGLMELFNMS